MTHGGGTLDRSVTRHLLAAGLVAAGILLAVTVWANLASLAGAVVSSGSFVVDSYVKKVQHPDGGVVGELLVREGQRVAANDILIRLDATQIRANVAVVQKRLDELTARQARLEAERDDLPAISFPEALLARGDQPDVARALHNEAQLFTFRQQSKAGQKSQLAERIAQYEMQITGLKAQADAYSRATELLAEEITNARNLRDGGLMTLAQLNALEREAATFGGELGEAMAGQAEAGGRIAETRLQILQIDGDLKTEIGAELRDVQAEIGEYVERLVAAEDQLRRIDIAAPQDGVVHELTVHAPGAVISPAEPVMLIVPDQDRLALDARIAPQDIDQLHLGQKAVLRLSAFDLRTTPELNGTVSRIAADLTTDRATGISYYLVRIELPPAELARLGDLALVPGMPAEAFIQTGERSALSYVLKPLSDQIQRAFREQ